MEISIHTILIWISLMHVGVRGDRLRIQLRIKTEYIRAYLCRTVLCKRAYVTCLPKTRISTSEVAIFDQRASEKLTIKFSSQSRDWEKKATSLDVRLRGDVSNSKNMYSGDHLQRCSPTTTSNFEKLLLILAVSLSY